MPSGITEQILIQTARPMEFTEVKIDKSGLQITKEEHFRLFNDFRDGGLSMRAAFMKVESACRQNGVKGYYSSFFSFKTAFYTSK